ncbi:hypothetical protein AB6A40_002765 [Gnathostoma spinigerum]|uniref:Uncharacterized protein n=1 Tax=Gnathostoma spinigerum TaxID=75299 RepID=A0ABD6E8W1_9BILA
MIGGCAKTKERVSGRCGSEHVAAQAVAAEGTTAGKLEEGETITAKTERRAQGGS